MEWLVILALAGWAVWQAQRIGALAERVSELEKALAAALEAGLPARMPASAQAQEPLLLTDVVAPDEDVLVLDTPVPEASNDIEAPQARAQAPALKDDPPLVLRRRADDEDAPLPPIPEAARPAPREAEAAERWFGESGLGWLGAAIVAAAAAVIALAMQQPLASASVRLVAAVALGVGAIGAGEWMLRRPEGNPAFAALCAGVGAAALYVASWAAHGLGLVEWTQAATLQAAAALLLMALALRHGQELGALAVVAALLIPALIAPALWPSAAATLFICAAAAGGLALAALRRWSWAAVVALGGLYLWFATAIAADEVRRALALLSFASLGGVALAFRKPLPAPDAAHLPWRLTHAAAPSVAISISSAVLFLVWLSIAPVPNGPISGVAWVGAMFVALAAAAVRARIAAPESLTVAIVMLVLGFAAYLRLRFTFGPPSADFYPFILFAGLAIVVSALSAKPHRKARTLVAASAAIGAALLVAFAAASRAEWHSPAAWAPLLLGAAALLGAAWIAAREAPDATANAGLDYWSGAGAALLLIGTESLLPAPLRAAGHGAAALAFAAGFAWRGWRALGCAALAAAALALLHAMSRELYGAALAGVLPLWAALPVHALAACALMTASLVAARRAPRSVLSEALSTAALIAVLIAAFLALSWAAAGGAGAPLTGFAEAALQALLLLAAGVSTLPRKDGARGPIAAWRGHVWIGAGVLHALFMCALVRNPWWGAAADAVDGAPVFNTLLLAFALPAALLAYAAARLYEFQRSPARLYAALSGAFALLWIVMALRHVFHGAAMDAARVGVFEGACYGLISLAAALAVAAAARWRAVRYEGPFTHDLLAVMRPCAWAGLIAGALILLALRHPWWGGQDPIASTDFPAGAAVFAQAIACALALALGRALSQGREIDPARFAAASGAALFALSFGHGAIRWAQLQGAMDGTRALADLEGPMHALWPLVFVLVSAALCARAPGRDSVRAYVGDLQAIWACAIWPALAFAALGLWLLYNPWWGVAPAYVRTPAAAAAAILSLLLAAGLSALAPRVPHARFRARLAQASAIAAAGHTLVALTLLVRASFHGGVIASEPPPRSGEIWAYALVWLAAGALAFLLARRFRRAPRDGDLLRTISGAGNGTRRDRRRRSGIGSR